MTPIIRADHLRHVYSAGTPFEKVAIDDIDLAIPAGQFVGIIGHTGSGKSTFIQHLNGLLAPTSGTVLFDGEDIHRSKAATRDVRFQVGLVFQYPEHQLFEETVYQDIAFGPKNARLSTEEVDARVREAARFAGVDESLFERSPLELSGGQKAKLQLAKMLLSGANLLLLDEPTSYLDIRYKLEFMSVLQELARRKKVAVILSIHELDLAERVSDWVLCVSPGQESQFGRPEEMLTPEHLSELFQVEEGRFRQTGGSMELPRPEGAPEVFVLAGGGSGRAVFWQLQRAGTTFAAGIVSEADLDYPAACTLASRLIAVPAFEEISEEKEQEARECLDACQCVIACRRQYGGWAAANDRLLAYAREKGKKIEYHNLPLHKMQ